MLKRLISSVVFFSCVFVYNFSYANLAPKWQGRDKKHTLLEPWKYGLGVSTGIASRRVAGFVEYKIKMLGVETGLGYFQDGYLANGIPLQSSSNDGGILFYKALFIPLILKLYPGSERQFALRVGLQTGFLLSHKIVPIVGATSSSTSFFTDKNPVDVSSVIASTDKLSNFYSAYILGFDYESDFGFIWGFDFMNHLSSLVDAKETIGTFSFMLDLGLNLGVFFY